MILPTFADVQGAAVRLRAEAYCTPLIRSEALDAACGGRVVVKAESLQRTGSFKFRGAYNRLSRLSPQERERGVVAFSSGNHAQGVACAARLLGLNALIVMPADAPQVKLQATADYGAEIVTYDRFTESREAIAGRIADERGSVLVPSYDDFHIMAGQGTVGHEAARQLADLGMVADVLLSPGSGGGLISGIGLAFEALSPSTKLYIVEPAGFEDHAVSLQVGEPVTIKPSHPSISDALLAPRPGDLTFAVNKRLLAGAAAATDDEALSAMAFAFRHLKLVLEPGGAVALAVLLSGAFRLEGRTALVIASGGNVDPELFRRVL